MRVSRIYCDNLKLVPIYVCSCCGTRRGGQYESIKVDVHDPRELSDLIENMPAPHPNGMPDGWSASGRHKLFCTNCK